MITVLIADDHKLIIEGVIKLFEKDPEIKFIARALNGIELEEQFINTKPDVVLADISMPIKNGIEAVKSLIKNKHDPKVLFLSQLCTASDFFSIYKAGGKGLSTKNCSKEILRKAITTVFNNNLYYNGLSDKEIETIISKFESVRKTNHLTKRELEVLNLLGEGKTLKTIGEILNIGSVRTVEGHCFHLKQKLEIQTHIELIKYAFEQKRNN
ncbi:MAG: response regulator transcription factor [Ignavibacteriae bacterium]|nr:response regulator transcription factor [Ignavibacteriota bacterium]MCB0753593.1 response regulator transcription factor [Ignavibacteriota bacterium]MCB9250759.1 response regulator transcription factor [Ignavibacteriales bacterium]